jgi:hypothetical protein
VVGDTRGGEILIGSNNKTIIIIILNMIISAPESDDTALEVKGVDDVDDVEVHGHFNCTRRIHRSPI